MPKDYPSFIHNVSGPWHYYVNNSLALTQPLTDNKQHTPFDALLSEQHIVASSKFSHVYQALLNDNETHTPVFVKQIHFKSAQDRIKQQFKNRAIKSFEAENLLKEKGFGAPTTLAIGWQKNNTFKNSFFSITEALNDHLDLYEIAKIFAQTPRIEKREFIKQFARVIAELHNSKIIHGDLRAGNVLCKKASTWTFSFIDNERTKIYKKLPERERIRNLVQLNLLISPNISTIDRQVFFNNYCQICFGKENSELFEKVILKTKARLSKLLENGRIKPSDLWL